MNDIIPPVRPPQNPQPPEPETLQPTGEQLPTVPPMASSAPQDKPRRSRKKIVLIVFSAIALVTILLSVAVWTMYMQQLAAVSSGSDEKVKVTIEPGSGPEAIGSTLKDAGVIRNVAAFTWYVRLNGQSSALQSGSYRLSKSEDVPAIVSHLTTGNTDTFAITFLPGATLDDHRNVLLNAGYEEGEIDGAFAKQYDLPLFDGKPASADLEGYIYGETYNFTANTTVEDILTRTFEQFQSVVTKENLVQEYESQGFTLYEGITMASIIQREVVTAEDAAQVAQVFKLRLERDIQLGSDVTYQYIADKTGQPRSVDLDSPYNTRRYKGLPPGPISSPGIAALRAAARPASGTFLYFLSGDDDKTYYAYTEEQHQRNIEQHCQRKCQII